MNNKALDDVDVAGKRALVLVSFNVPLKDGRVVDDSRIRAGLPTIRELRKQSAKVVLMSHLGRPKGEKQDDLRLDPVASRLGELLGAEVAKTDEVCGETAECAVAQLDEGEVLLLENTRFHPGGEEDWRIVDVGDTTLENFDDVLREARSVIWNGPVDWMEQDPFGRGTESIARSLAGLSLRPSGRSGE